MRPSFKDTVVAIKAFFDSVSSLNAWTHKAQVNCAREPLAKLQEINIRHTQASDRGFEFPELATHALISFEKGSPDAEAVALALEMRANYVETKDPLLSTNDIIERRKVLPVVGEPQKDLVRRLRGIAQQLRRP